MFQHVLVSVSFQQHHHPRRGAYATVRYTNHFYFILHRGLAFVHSFTTGFKYDAFLYYPPLHSDSLNLS